MFLQKTSQCFPGKEFSGVLAAISFTFYRRRCSASSQAWEGEWLGHLFAIKTSSLGLAVSPWPKFRKNNRNTGRFGD